LSKTYPLVFQAFDWSHGVYMGATLGSEATAAAVGQAEIRRDPMAMLPFCGYNMGDYWGHWLAIGRSVPDAPPIFRVNWFRKDEKGKFIWPGFGENMRVLQWIVERVHGRAGAVESPFGYMPRHQDMNWTGASFAKSSFHSITSIDRAAARREAEEQRDWLNVFGSHLPKEIELQRQMLVARLEAAPAVWTTPD
jgi:phosphoenolpyruvate carboxykinase (GTP)